MECYVGLDVSLKQTSICVVNQAGSVVREGVVDSDPETIAAFVRSKAPGAVRVGLETGPTATWLWTELKQLGLPVICIDARHAKAVLKMQINKSDRNDAAGIARIMQTGWFKQVRVKDLDSHAVRALLASRALLVKIKRDLENQVRGLLKNLGLVIGRAKFNVFAVRAEELIADRPDLVAAIGPLLEARKAIEQQVRDLDRKVLKLARHDVQVRRFMTAPGVGPITALCFKATIDDPTRFRRSRSVGAYVGLTTRRHASGEVDWSGRISKCGDAMLRAYLFEAANVLLTRVPKWSTLKAWGMRLAKRNGLRKAKVAVARKLAVIAPLAFEAVKRIDAIFDIEREINGRSIDERLAVRRTLVAPLVSELETWLRAEYGKLSRRSDVAKAMNYMLTRWDTFTRFLNDGRICLTSNGAERALRRIALGRKSWLFAGSDRGGERAAVMYTLIQTARLNDVDPQAWLADVLARINDHNIQKLDALLPWNWKTAVAKLAA